MARWVWGLLLGLTLITSSCSRQYRIGNEIFNSKEAALAHMDKINQDVLDQIVPTDRPVHGSLLVAIPNAPRLKELGIQKPPGMYLDEDSTDFYVQYQKKTYVGMCQFVEKRQIFDTVTITDSSAPDTVPVGNYDYILYLHLTSPGNAQWYLKARDWNNAKPVFIEATQKVGFPKTLAWLDYLESAARQQ